jgi:hypothetical protein
MTATCEVDSLKKTGDFVYYTKVTKISREIEGCHRRK